MPVARGKVLGVRLTEPELEAVQRAARKARVAVSVWARARVLEGLDVRGEVHRDVRQVELFARLAEPPPKARRKPRKRKPDA